MGSIPASAPSLLLKIRRLSLDTQELRRRLIESLQELFERVGRWAKDDPEAARLAGYIAQVLNGLAKSYEAYELNEDLRELQSLIERAKGLRERLEREAESGSGMGKEQGQGQGQGQGKEKEEDRSLIPIDGDGHRR
jgi:hypothetical protein